MSQPFSASPARMRGGVVRSTLLIERSLLTKRRPVDFCLVAASLCRP